MTMRTRTDVLLLAGFCAFLFFYGNGQFGLIGADEPRYAQVAREMHERNDWITPTLGGEPWLEKPPLYYWQAMLVYSVLPVSDMAARLPSALDATLLVIAIYLFFRRFRRGTELDAALITASCAGIVGYARAASMDMALATTFSIAMLAWWTWRETNKRLFLALTYFFLALGMLAKGPVAPFLAIAILLLFAGATGEWRRVLKTLWLPGILLFCVVALPWYLAVQMRNPEFFREFILEHNLARFSSDLYHHRQPFWYYVPVTLMALVPWTVFVIAAIVERGRLWWKERNFPEPDMQLLFSVFAICWFILPVIFFSVSRSKLPGYILPAIPAATVLLADYVRDHLEHRVGVAPVSKSFAVMHALVAAAPIVPALLVGYAITEHRLPAGRSMLIALGVAFILCAAIALTLLSGSQLRMLRFITLIPVVLAVAAVLKLGTNAIDQNLSARPLAWELANMETHRLPLAVYGVPREVEYGLAFYRNQKIGHYEPGSIPKFEHLLVAPSTWKGNVTKETAGRRISFLTHYAPQGLDCYWVSAEKK